MTFWFRAFFASTFLFAATLAQALPCDQSLHSLLAQTITDSKTAYQKLNQEMVEKYPALENILRDPNQYKSEMEIRFRQQKAIDPTHPYRFDFSDQAGPTLRWMQKSIPAKIAKIEIIQRQMSSERSAQSQSYTTVLHYLTDLQNEINGYLAHDNVKVDYQSFFEVSYFFSRAIGLLDTTLFPAHVRWYLQIDRSLDGFKEYSPAQEYDFYRRREVNVFTEKSTTAGFVASEESFLKAMWNPERLDMVMVPTQVSFSRDIFLRMMPFGIHFFGLTDEPVLSEGFLRPGGDFFVHDARHESTRIYKWNNYVEKHHLSKLQIQALKLKMDQWQNNLNEQLKLIPDDNLRGAVMFLLFSNHHDRGIPLTPSAYLRDKIEMIPLALYTMMKIGGQKTDFKWGYSYLPKAHEWLKNYWRPLLPEEIALIGNSDF
jgi:hypothetical protein